MAISINVQSTVSDGGAVRITSSIPIDVGAVSSVDESIANGATNTAVAFSVPLTGLKVFFLVSDFGVTVKTNNSSTPQDTFNLVGGKPRVWVTGDVTAAPIAGAVTGLFVTNSSGSAARIQLMAAYDPTP